MVLGFRSPSQISNGALPETYINLGQSFDLWPDYESDITHFESLDSSVIATHENGKFTLTPTKRGTFYYLVCTCDGAKHYMQLIVS